MKITIAIIVLLIIAAAGFFITSNQADAPVAADGVPATSQELEAMNNSTNESDAATSGMVIEGSTAADTEVVSVDTNVDAGLEPLVFTVDSFNYGYSMEEIRVPAGTEVTINLTNSGGFHDLVIDEFAAATEKISAGGATSVTFVADKAGTYEYYCSVGNHRAQGMVGTLIVE